eukprot:TRINITY_DN2330_c0_g2_i1.p1 TRINITY_DN2330_c0_g2~~TRINITY_DN2330_c0_g2_i1.p1  ORF type:complete len:565 (+),score=146.47 TRINITY_DN2330_c0_g2_i1:130-1695(+)
MEKKMTIEQKKEILEQAKQLKQYQDHPADNSCLPKLTIADIPKHGKYVQTHQIQLNSAPLQIVKSTTNGLSYVRLFFNIEALPQEDHELLPLFASLITTIGAGDMDSKALAQEKEMYTGSLSASTSLQLHYSESGLYQKGFIIEGSCLHRNISKMFDLIETILLSPNFTFYDFMLTRILSNTFAIQDSVIDDAHSYAVAHSASYFNSLARVNENLGGLSQLKYLQQIDQDLPALQALAVRFKKLGERIFNRNVLRGSIVSEAEYIPQLYESFSKLFDQLTILKNKEPSSSCSSSSSSSASPSSSSSLSSPIHHPAHRFMTNEWIFSQKRFHFIPYPVTVNFVSQTIPGVPYSHPDSAALDVCRNLLSIRYLHPQVREKGGAYGSGVTHAAGAHNLLSFFSYRDPNIERTIQVFENSSKWLNQDSFTDQDIEETKLKIFQRLDAPLVPSSHGSVEFLSYITPEMRESKRRQIFEISRKEIHEVAEKYLHFDKSVVSVIGNAQLAENLSPNQWSIIDFSPKTE